MKYLVTGGLGVIGSHITRTLLEAGNDVLVVDACEEKRNHWIAVELRKTPRQGRLGIIMERLERLERLANLSSFLGDIDRVIHCAAFTGIPQSAVDPCDDWTSNAEATRCLLEALRRAERTIPTVVLSSVKPYRVHDIPVHADGTRWAWSDRNLKGIHEDWPLAPDEPYAASKLAQSALCQAYARSYGLPVTVLRCSNLYGAAPSHGPRHGWLTWFCISAAIYGTIQVQGSGLQVRDMLFASDVESAVAVAFDHMEKCQGEVFNIGGGQPNTISVIEAAGCLADVVPGLSVVKGPGRRHEDPVFITDHRKFTKVTGWTPAVGVHGGMRAVLEWAKARAEELRQVYSVAV